MPDSAAARLGRLGIPPRVCYSPESSVLATCLRGARFRANEPAPSQKRTAVPRCLPSAGRSPPRGRSAGRSRTHTAHLSHRLGSHSIFAAWPECWPSKYSSGHRRNPNANEDSYQRFSTYSTAAGAVRMIVSRFVSVLCFSEQQVCCRAEPRLGGTSCLLARVSAQRHPLLVMLAHGGVAVGAQVVARFDKQELVWRLVREDLKARIVGRLSPVRACHCEVFA